MVKTPSIDKTWKTWNIANLYDLLYMLISEQFYAY